MAAPAFEHPHPHHSCHVDKFLELPEEKDWHYRMLVGGVHSRHQLGVVLGDWWGHEETRGSHFLVEETRMKEPSMEPAHPHETKTRTGRTWKALCSVVGPPRKVMLWEADPEHYQALTSLVALAFCSTKIGVELHLYTRSRPCLLRL
jgi:hypothetical protein